MLIQNVRPRTIIAPLQLALTVSLHHHFASWYLIDTLNKLGFCSSYSEVQRFESCAAQQNCIDLSDIGHSSSLHFISDNVDHNLDTIDGLNTFHGMRTIACVTPPKLVDPNSLVIKRLTVYSKDVIEAGKFEIKYFDFKHDIGLAKKFEASPPLVSSDNKKVLGNVWQFAWLVKPMKPLLFPWKICCSFSSNDRYEVTKLFMYIFYHVIHIKPGKKVFC